MPKRGSGEEPAREAASPPVRGKVRHVDYSPDEFLQGVALLTPEQIGFYWLMCSLIYSHGGPIPDDDEEIARMLRVRVQRWRRAKAELLERGKLQRVAGSLTNRRCESEIARAHKRIKDAREAGKLGGRPRKTAAAPQLGNANGFDIAALWDRFWKAYPSRGGAANPKKPALEKFAKLLKAGIDPEAIIAGASAYAAAMRKSGKAGTELVAQATTFLNQARWEQYATPRTMPAAPALAGKDPYDE